jgi:large-conductance mechanosensitive channel
MKTWEKWYWGVDIALIIFSLVGYKVKPENFTMEIDGVKRVMTFGELIMSLFLFYIVFFGLIWLVVRLIVNKGWSEKRER